MADHWRSPVMRFFTITQSPAAYTSGRLVRSRSSTRMVPLNISRPVSVSQAVLGRTPTLSTTRSAGRVPAAVRTPVAAPSAVRISATFTPVSTRSPASCSCLRAKAAISGSSTLGMIWPAISATVTDTFFSIRFSAISRPMKPPPTTTARRTGFSST